MKKFGIFFLVLILGSCSEHEVDTWVEYCEQISGDDLEEKYNPWGLLFSFSFNEEAVRKDLVKNLNVIYIEAYQGRDPKPVWREGLELFIVNNATYFVTDPEIFVQEWKKGLKRADNGEALDREDYCLYGAVSYLFERVHILHLNLTIFGNPRVTNEEIIETSRNHTLEMVKKR